MKLLLDTHVLLWWLSDNPRLGSECRDAMASQANRICVSVVSLWEIVIKVHVKKLGGDIMAVEDMLGRSGFERLAILPSHLDALAGLPAHHRDPFDHLLIAQAIAEDAVLVTYDKAMSLYPVRLLGGIQNA